MELLWQLGQRWKWVWCVGGGGGLWRQEVMLRESYLEMGLTNIWFLQVVFIFGGLFEFWATEKLAKFQES